MDWTQIDIEINCADIELGSSIAHMVVPYGIYIEDYSDLEELAPQIAHIDLIDEELLKKDRTKAVIHLYIPEDQHPHEAVVFLTDRLQAAGIEFAVGCSSIAEEDWAFGWKKYYHPLPIGDHLVVCPSWENYDKKPGEVVVTLDPGMAFGTGTHNTTKLCLELMQPVVKPGSTVLDIGCGSGILAVSALLCGADSALLCDIDATAVKVARENAALNGVEDRCQFIQGDLAAAVDQQYDLFFANIVADIIIRLLPDVRGHLKPGGRFIASGIVDVRRDEVLAAVAQNGLEVEQMAEDGGWVALLCRAR
ncbi:Ribosomal protein L11 methyltransferase [Anaerotruncus sp. 2789STDY5834896]|uniref:Ribosomal protein L11 methyltransferase n=1 Tax=uncultured Anaerotruncus sp. TaxID=905011 RepID=A0A1C6JC21_9FIRM|nr:Ribosomal protein L11 methyltransferase [uncultured Anaerotruncus sp.]